jgi:hypothetical protein
VAAAAGFASYRPSPIESGSKRERYLPRRLAQVFGVSGAPNAGGTHGSANVASAFVMRHHDSERLARYPSTDIRGIEATYIVATLVAVASR